MKDKITTTLERIGKELDRQKQRAEIELREMQEQTAKIKADNLNFKLEMQRIKG